MEMEPYEEALIEYKKAWGLKIIPLFLNAMRSAGKTFYFLLF